MIKRIKTLQTSCLYTIFSLITYTQTHPHSLTHTRNDLWTLLGINLQPLLANCGMILAWSYNIVRSSQHLCYTLPFPHPTNKPTTEHCSLAHTHTCTLYTISIYFCNNFFWAPNASRIVLHKTAGKRTGFWSICRQIWYAFININTIWMNPSIVDKQMSELFYACVLAKYSSYF